MNPPPGDEPWSETRVLKTLWPPQAGTKRLRNQLGARLVCVRYRRDMTSGHRYTTVEILVDHAPVRRRGEPLHEMVEVALRPSDKSRQSAIKALGGRWIPETKNWRLTRRAAMALGLKPVGGGSTRKGSKPG